MDIHFFLPIISLVLGRSLREGFFDVDGNHDDLLTRVASLDQAVRDDVELLKKSRAIPESITISGWVYDVRSGKVRKVV